MKKYWAVFRTHFQTMVVYRGPILVWLLGNVLSLMVMVAVWLSASAGQTIGGYTKEELVTYYLAALFLEWIAGWFPFYGVKEEIKNGSIVVKVLAKPISYFWQKFAEDASWHVVSSVVGFLATMACAYFLRSWLVFDFVGFGRAAFLALTVFLSILATFTFSFCLGLLAFWFTEVGAADSLFWMVRLILGGQAIPISFIPGFFQGLVRILPFRYMFSFPLEVYFNKLSLGEVIQGLTIQAFWVLVLVWLYKLMWGRGRRVYTAFGQ